MKKKADNFMFSDQKRYLLLFHITSDFVSLFILYYFLIALFLLNDGDFILYQALNGQVMGAWFFAIPLFIVLSLIFTAIPLVLMWKIKGYRKSGVQNILTLCWQSALLCIIVAAILFFFFCFFDFSLEKNVFLSVISAILLFPLLALNRLYILHLIKKSSSNNNLIKHLLLAGTGFKAQSISAYIENHPESGLRITGFLTDKDDEIGKKISNKKVLGKAENLIQIVHNNYTDCVVYTEELEDTRCHKVLLKKCSVLGIDFATTQEGFHDKAIGKKRIFSERIGNIELKIKKFVYITPQASFFKRVFDFFFNADNAVPAFFCCDCYFNKTDITWTCFFQAGTDWQIWEKVYSV